MKFRKFFRSTVVLRVRKFFRRTVVLRVRKFFSSTVSLRESLAQRGRVLSGKLPLRLEVLIVSAGGSGSTTLIKHVSKYYRCNDPSDRDGLKHLPAPPPPDLAEKIIYVGGDFRDIKISLGRRGLLLPQVLKLRPYSSTWKLVGLFDFENLARLQRTKFSESLETPVFFVHYNDLFESAQAISDFLGHRDGFVSTFPMRYPRNSDRSNKSRERFIHWGGLLKHWAIWLRIWASRLLLKSLGQNTIRKKIVSRIYRIFKGL